eukprot:COSAG01_NODE_31_length_35900_cov_44.332169_22_plen_90_part_00
MRPRPAPPAGAAAARRRFRFAAVSPRAALRAPRRSAIQPYSAMHAGGRRSAAAAIATAQHSCAVLCHCMHSRSPRFVRCARRLLAAASS